MDDDQIYQRGGDERDIEEYAKQNGATDPITEPSFEEWIKTVFQELWERGIFKNNLTGEPSYSRIKSVLREAHTLGKREGEEDVTNKCKSAYQHGKNEGKKEGAAARTKEILAALPEMVGIYGTEWNRGYNAALQEIKTSLTSE